MTGQHSDKNQYLFGKSEAWYKDLVDHARDLIQCVDSEGRFIYVNQTWLSTLKLMAEDIAGITLWDIIHPDSMEHCMAAFEQVIQGKAAGEVEATFVTKDGTPVAVEGNVSVKLDDNGRFVHTRGIFRNVTARKKMEASLMEAKAENRALLEAIPDLMFLFNKAGHFIDYKTGNQDSLLIGPENFVGKHVSESLPPDLAALTLERLADLFESGNPQLYEYPLEIAGEHKLFESRLVPCGDDRALAIVRDITDRRQAEKELRESDERFRSIIAVSNTGAWEYHLKSDYLWCSPEYFIMLGRNQKDYAMDGRANLKETWLDLLHPEDREQAGKYFAEYLKNGSVGMYENHFRMQHANGSWVWIWSRGQTLRNPDGSLTGKTVGTHINVTERKHAEEALRESENRFRSFLENLPVGTYRVTPGPEGEILMANPAFMRMFGMKNEEELEKLKMSHLYYDPADREIAANRVIEKGGYGAYELKLRKKNGQIIYCLDTARLVCAENGTPLYFDCVLEDITDRKRAEEALKASEQKHREILAAMEEGYYEVDLAGNFVFFNESICRMLGYSSDELMGKSYKQFYKNPQEVFNIYNKVYKTGKSVTAADWPAITRDGRNICLELSILLRLNEKGEPVGFRGVVRDITARRQTDEKIRHLSYHDQLTGLYNRHYLEEEMKRLDTERQLPISVIMADLNGLKLVNDTYGHHAGDEMLKRAAGNLRSVCREDDLLARFGGDEFVLYLPRTSYKEAQKISGRIEKACRREQVSDVPLSLSTGVAVKISSEQKLSDMLKEAEDNMYRDKLTESRSGKSAIVNSLLQTLAAKSFETEAHTRNMQEAAKSIGEKLGMPHSELHRLQLLITLHDIGKINIPEELLTKKSSLSDAEWKIMKKHSETGYRIAKTTESFAHVAEDILAHHERWDGSGYPQGLKGEAIPLLARITAIADAYEVMCNGRPYKKVMSRNEIVAELNRCSGSQFDPDLVELFLSILEIDG